VDLTELDALVVCWLLAYVPDFALCVRQATWLFEEEDNWMRGGIVAEILLRLTSVYNLTLAYKNIHLEDQRVRFTHMAAWLPFETITELCLCDVNFSTNAAFCEIVGRLVNLKELEVEGVNLWNWDVFNPDLHHCPHLCCLTLGLGDNGFARKEILSWLMVHHDSPSKLKLEVLRVNSECSLFLSLATDAFQYCANDLREITFRSQFTFLT
jgi:hypothetical protein